MEYFVGPCLVYMVYYAVAGSYLTQFYTDVLGLSGIFLTLGTWKNTDDVREILSQIRC